MSVSGLNEDMFKTFCESLFPSGKVDLSTFLPKPEPKPADEQLKEYMEKINLQDSAPAPSPQEPSQTRKQRRIEAKEKFKLLTRQDKVIQTMKHRKQEMNEKLEKARLETRLQKFSEKDQQRLEKIIFNQKK
jgi:hypothetical protein